LEFRVVDQVAPIARRAGFGLWQEFSVRIFLFKTWKIERISAALLPATNPHHAAGIVDEHNATDLWRCGDRAQQQIGQPLPVFHTVSAVFDQPGQILDLPLGRDEMATDALRDDLQVPNHQAPGEISHDIAARRPLNEQDQPDGQKDQEAYAQRQGRCDPQAAKIHRSILAVMHRLPC
jgi:hypothetical protein